MARVARAAREHGAAETGEARAGDSIPMNDGAEKFRVASRRITDFSRGIPMAITRREMLRATGLLASGTLLAADAKKAAASAPAGATATGAAAAPPLVDISDYAREAPRHMAAMSWEYMS